MSDAPESGEKTHEPTPKKLQDARKEGQIAKSTDLSAAAAYVGLILALTVLGPTALLDAATKLSHFISEPLHFSNSDRAMDSASIAGLLGSLVLTSLLPLFAIPAIAVALSLVAQKAFTFAPSKIRPKLSKISPITSAKNKFGATGHFEFAKSATKLLVVSLVMVWFLKAGLPEILQTVDLQPPQMTGVLGSQILAFLTLLLVVSIIVGGVDYLWQVAEHHRKNRMTRKEVEDESKEAEGDPHNKQARRQRGLEIAMNQMLSDVPDATVIIVNPTHYAVALKWDESASTAPICVAKGVDEIAARIREIALKSSIPIHHDPPSARSLFARIEVGSEVWPDDYRAVAAAIRFAQSVSAISRRKP
ncbi:EscU/YscU/HrcU family type III secretion system export apparatus switch protein [Litoreibacter halocynthiae]|uniref:EscU/YscU/HrcU family type III secretion system export apparatus switch protein n=1 Tax=Litoreibacter halocynthiae TaxID=1242689 RepID=UPI002490EA05|nr:flagellar type III secretion system protein FlhB [Litoreibacter halocynthiae]